MYFEVPAINDPSLALQIGDDGTGSGGTGAGGVTGDTSTVFTTTFTTPSSGLPREVTVVVGGKDGGDGTDGGGKGGKGGDGPGSGDGSSGSGKTEVGREIEWLESIGGMSKRCYCCLAV